MKFLFILCKKKMTKNFRLLKFHQALYWKWKSNKKIDLKSVCNLDKEYFICKNRTAGVLVASHSCGVIVNY